MPPALKKNKNKIHFMIAIKAINKILFAVSASPEGYGFYEN